jgi:hypothetical protein
MHVSIMIPQGHAVVNSILRAFNIFNWVNECLVGNGQRPLFDLHLVGVAPRADLYGGIASVMPDLTLADAFSSDLIIIPALAGDISEGLKNHAPFIPWMKQQYKMGAEIASLCTGVFLLAATGLMDGSKRTTHWFVAADCRNAFRQIKLGTERMIPKENRIHSRCGAYAFFDLMIKKFAGAEVAIQCSKFFETDFNRECQSVVATFNKQKRQKESELRDKISREQFARMFVINRRKPSSSLKSALTSCVVRDGQKGLEPSYEKTKDIRPEVCYNNTRAFRNIFKKIDGF